MTASRAHLTALHAQLSAQGYKTREAKLALLSEVFRRDVKSSKDLTTQEINQVSQILDRMRGAS